MKVLFTHFGAKEFFYKMRAGNCISKNVKSGEQETPYFDGLGI
jgi:hypothetical protein